MITRTETQTTNQHVAENDSYLSPLLQNNGLPGGNEDEEDDEDPGDPGKLEDVDFEDEDIESAIEENDEPVLDEEDLEENGLDPEDVEDIDWKDDEDEEAQ